MREETRTDHESFFPASETRRLGCRKIYTWIASSLIVLLFLLLLLCCIVARRQNKKCHCSTTSGPAVDKTYLCAYTGSSISSFDLSDTGMSLCTKRAHAHTRARCCDPREQASCVCAGAATPALIINQWANCKGTQSASPAHMTSRMHVNIHRVYKLFKVSPLPQYSGRILADGRHKRPG